MRTGPGAPHGGLKGNRGRGRLPPCTPPLEGSECNFICKLQYAIWKAEVCPGGTLAVFERFLDELVKQ